MSGVDINVKELEEIAPGVLKKNDKTFYIQCNVHNTWHYCNAIRLEKQIKKFGSVEELGLNYKSRDAKREERPPPRKKGERVRSWEQEAALDSSEPKRTYTYLKPPSTDFRSMRAADEHGDPDARMYRFTTEDNMKCLRPSIIRNSDGFCNGCPWWHYCQMEQKAWRVKEEDPHNRGAWVDHKQSPINYFTQVESVLRSTQRGTLRSGSKK